MLAAPAGAPRIWGLALTELLDHLTDIQHALDVLNTYYHPPEKYATAAQLDRPAPEITIPAEGTLPTQHPRLTFRFRAKRQGPRSHTQQSSNADVKAASNAASRRPARCRDERIHGARNSQRAFAPAHMVHTEAPLLNLRRPHHRPPFDPAIDGFTLEDDHPSRRERQFLYEGMAGQGTPAAAAAAAGTAAAGAAAAAAIEAQVQAEAAPAEDEDEDEEELEPASSSDISGGMYQNHVSKRDIRKAVRAFDKDHVGRDNPLIPLIQLVVFSKREMIATLNEAMQCYARELCLPETSDIGKVRFCSSPKDARAPVRQLVQLFFARPPVSAETVERITREQLIDEWVARFTPKDGDKDACRARITSYMADHPPAPLVLERYLTRSYSDESINADHGDPCLLHIASVFLDGKGSLYPDLPGEKDDWVGEVMQIGVHQKRMRSQAALKQWLRSELSWMCGKHLAAQALPILWDAEHPAVADEDWTSTVHGRLGTTPDTAGTLHAFLELFRDHHSFLPLREAYLSIGSILARPKQAYGELVPFFGMLGRDFAVVSASSLTRSNKRWS